MCHFFSFVTEPDGHPNERFYFNWEQRQKDFDGADSHDHIISTYKLDDKKCNSYEYNPLAKEFKIDQQNSQIDDRVQAEKWVSKLDFKRVVEPLIIKPVVNPLDLPKIKRVTKIHKQLLKDWASVRDLVRDSVWDSIGNSVWDSVRDLVRDSVWDSIGDSVMDSVMDSVRNSVGASVWASVRDSVWAYCSTFFDVKYRYDFTPLKKLWESGLVPSYEDKTWRLHSGKKADVVYEVIDG